MKPARAPQEGRGQRFTIALERYLHTHAILLDLRLSYSSSQDAAWIHLSSLMCQTKAAASKLRMHAPHLQSVTLANPRLHVQPIASNMDINGRLPNTEALPGHRTDGALYTSHDTVNPQPHIDIHQILAAVRRPVIS